LDGGEKPVPTIKDEGYLQTPSIKSKEDSVFVFDFYRESTLVSPIFGDFHSSLAG